MLMTWGIYTHTLSICPVAVSNPITRVVWIAYGLILYAFSTIAYAQTVWIGGGSPIDVSASQP